MVYLAEKNGRAIAHADKQAMLELDGVEKPGMAVTDAEWEAAGGLARIINGEIVIGKTAGEKAEEEKQAKIDGCMAELAAIDLKYGQRATRSLALKAARGAKINEADADLLRLCEAEEQAGALRRRMAALKEGIGE